MGREGSDPHCPRRTPTKNRPWIPRLYVSTVEFPRPWLLYGACSKNFDISGCHARGYHACLRRRVISPAGNHAAPTVGTEVSPRICFFLLKPTPPGGNPTPRGDVFISAATRGGGSLPRGVVQNFSLWPTHKDNSSGECATDKVSEQPSGHQGGKGDSDTSDKKKESSSSWGSLAPGPKKQKKGPPCREYPPTSFTLRRVSGSRGRNAYEKSSTLILQ